MLAASEKKPDKATEENFFLHLRYGIVGIQRLHDAKTMSGTFPWTRMRKGKSDYTKEGVLVNSFKLAARNLHKKDTVYNVYLIRSALRRNLGMSYTDAMGDWVVPQSHWKAFLQTHVVSNKRTPLVKKWLLLSDLIMHQHTQGVEALVENGVFDVDEINDKVRGSKNTPLTLAVSWCCCSMIPGTLGILDTLIRNGARVNGLDGEGCTPLAIAIATYSESDRVSAMAVINWLLDKGGANPNEFLDIDCRRNF